MMTHIDIKAVEQHAWRSFFSDGRLELSFGLAFLILGMMLVFPDGPIHWIFIIAVLLLPGTVGFACKKYVTEPRIGRVTFSRRRRLNMAGAVLFLAAAVLFGMAAWITATSMSQSASSWISSNWILVLLIAKVVLVFAAVAYFLDYIGVFFIGLGLAACFLVNEVWDSPILFFIVGALIALAGIVKLVVFIRSHPVVPAAAE